MQGWMGGGSFLSFVFFLKLVFLLGGGLVSGFLALNPSLRYLAANWGRGGGSWAFGRREGDDWGGKRGNDVSDTCLFRSRL